MIILISPAKKLATKSTPISSESPMYFPSETMHLVEIMRQRSIQDLKELMGISDKLATLNVERFQKFESQHTAENSNAALFEFQGDVYQGLDAASFDAEDIEFATEHLRILSGLYGLLRPNTLIQPYRLEMGTSLATEKGKDLYAFWDMKITDQIAAELSEHRNNLLVNLASKEYTKAVRFDRLKGTRVIEVQFKEWKGDQLKFISFNAKKARGLMARYIIQNKIRDADSLKLFNLEGYAYQEDLSSEDNIMFTR